ncbi:GNAT family N-acetyltransferase [Maribellus mangrovi]|uniref:GNAT family N-acetyltransferase n=1 Tax=Maribellus mangrovi TaxID=3133146 RepID=UPI0030EB3B76
MSNDPLIITPAKAIDLDEILTLFVDTINKVCARDYSPKQRSAWTAGAKNTERWKKKLNRQYFVVARLEETLVGFASLENNYIDFLFVHKDFQGHGIAGKLLDVLEQKASESNIEKLVSDVSLIARPFFERAGFEVIQEQNKLIRGENLINYRMQKMLT